MVIEHSLLIHATGSVGILLIASPVIRDVDAKKVIYPAVDGPLNGLKAAAKPPSVKKVMLTFSASAVLHVDVDENVDVDEDTWNQFATEEAWMHPPYKERMEQFRYVYDASKVESEKVAWKSEFEDDTGFVLNTSTRLYLLSLLNQHAAPEDWFADQEVRSHSFVRFRRSLST